VYWNDSQGNRIRIDEMGNRYLVNCINWVKRLCDEDENYLPSPTYYQLIAEYEKRCEKYKKINKEGQEGE